MVKCSSCGLEVTPVKDGDRYICPNCAHEIIIEAGKLKALSSAFGDIFQKFSAPKKSAKPEKKAEVSAIEEIGGETPIEPIKGETLIDAPPPVIKPPSLNIIPEENVAEPQPVSEPHVSERFATKESAEGLTEEAEIPLEDIKKPEHQDAFKEVKSQPEALVARENAYYWKEPSKITEKKEEDRPKKTIQPKLTPEVTIPKEELTQAPTVVVKTDEPQPPIFKGMARKTLSRGKPLEEGEEESNEKLEEELEGLKKDLGFENRGKIVIQKSFASQKEKDEKRFSKNIVTIALIIAGIILIIIFLKDTPLFAAIAKFFNFIPIGLNRIFGRS